MYLTKIKKDLLKLATNTDVWTSLAYSQDRRRRALNELKQHKYFKQLSRFHFKRTDKAYENNIH